MIEDSQSQCTSHKSKRSVFPSSYHGGKHLLNNKNKKLSYISDQDLFKLAAINMPRHAILHAMPVSLQVESIEINRMRSHYIKIIMAVWRSYCKHVFGATCPVFGSFTKQGELIPS